MIATIFCTLLGFAVGSMVTLTPAPRGIGSILGPLIAVVVAAAIIGRS